VHSAFGTSRPAATRAWATALGWWNRARQRQAVADELARPQLALNRRDIVLVAVTLATAAALAAAALLITYQRSLARDQAGHLIQRADRALERIDDDLVSLASSQLGTGIGCSMELTLALARRSLDSALVRHYLLEHDSRTCGPLGEQPAPTTAAPTPGLRLSTTSTIAPRLTAQRRLESGAVAWADIELSALQQVLRTNDDAGVQRHAQLQHVGGDALLALDNHVQHFPRDSAISAVQRSDLYPVQVAVALDPHALRIAIAWHAAVAGLTALALLGGVTLVAWRHTLRRARLRERIAKALRKRQFEPFVQPVVELVSGRCVGGEILMRWNHPQRGWIAPIEFIDEAERTGLIVGMTQLVMERAALRLAPLARAAPGLRFAFNVTPVDLRQPGFAARLATAFQAASLPREQVILELTERDLVDAQAADALVALRNGGWGIAMDDFGTGQSSLALLERLQVDRIKIDRSFVQTIDAATQSRPVLDAIIGLAHGLKVPLVAEGVETEAQRDYLAARGVTHAQGYLWARPMPLADYERWLVKRDDVLAQRLEPAASGPGLDAESRALWDAMRGPGGLEVRDRVWHARQWPRCFVGREAVDWIASQLGVNRATALRMGRRLAAFGLIRHVADEHDFRDARLFYRFAEPGDDNAPTGPTVPPDLAAALRSGTADGLPLGDHRRGVALHRRCARGRDIIGWIMTRHGVDASTALQWGAALMRMGRLRHVYDDRPFSANGALFRPA
jgi:EAL domain-containing protein (putative c-di-GMP-specific phosphodiesterase class I)